MKTKITITVFLLICLCSTAWAQKKVIQIKTSFELPVRYIPSGMKSVGFDVEYTNHTTESSPYNYKIKFNPNGDTKFTGKEPILLKSPIDIEAMRQELNEKLQIVGDSIVRAVSNNTIYDMAYILDTIPNPIAQRTIAGNLILSSYVKVFDSQKKETLKDHKIRQDSIQSFIRPVIMLTLNVDNLIAKRLELDSLIGTNNNKIESINFNKTNNKSVLEGVNRIKKANEDSLSESQKLHDSLKESMKKSEETIKKTNLDIDDKKLLVARITSLKKVANDTVTAEILAEKFVELRKSEKDTINKKDLEYYLNLLKNPKSIDIEFSKNDKSLKELREIYRSSNIQRSAFEYNNETISKVNAARKQQISSLQQKLDGLEMSALNRELEKSDIDRAKLEEALKRNFNELKVFNDSISKAINALKTENIFQINKVSLQIERGFIERIQVYVPSKNSDQYNIYENIYAIGFSSINNYKNFPRTKLFSRLTEDYIYLSDVVANFDNLLENYTRDYSPADTTINHFKPKQGFIRLNREQFANLFDARIYTDLMGIRNDKPNGLIQIDIARKFNILTSRRQINKTRSDVGGFTYINMFGSISKIENNKKYLPLRNENIGNAGQLTSPYYATNLDFRLYQNLSLGAELNLFLFDYPDGKLTGYLDVGSTYGQTPLTYNKRTVIGNTVSQSERDSSLIAHSATIYPKLTLEIFSEKRVRLSMSYQFNTTRIYSNNNFKAIASYAKSDLLDRATEPYARRSHMLEVNLTASPTSSKHGRFFLRARYFIQNRDHNTFFSQIQFGYTYNLRLKKFE